MRETNSRFRFVLSTIIGSVLSLVMIQAQPSLATGPTTELLAFNSSLQFIFTEPMDSNGIDITWEGNIDASKFECSWLQSFPGIPAIILQCNYQGGLPDGIEVTYTLNAGGSGVMKSISGQALPEVSGSFVTPGDNGNGGGGNPPTEPDCDDEPVNTQEEGVMYLFQNLEFLQDGAVLRNHPERPHGMAGGLRVPAILGNADFSNLTLTKPNGTSEDLVQFENPVGPNLFILSTQPLPNIAPPSFSEIAMLQESYPAGRYQFSGQSNLGNLSIPLQKGNLNVVSDPLFREMDNIPHENLAQTWTLQWNPAIPVNANTHISISIEDLNGIRIFSAPNRCENIELVPTANSISIPSGTLSTGQNYRVSLNFFTLTDQGETQAFGIRQYAGIGKRTEMIIGPGTSNPQPVELNFTDINLSGSGAVITVTGHLNATTPSVMIEQSTDLKIWTPFTEVTLDMLQQGGGSTELMDATAPLFPTKIYRIPLVVIGTLP